MEKSSGLRRNASSVLGTLTGRSTFRDGVNVYVSNDISPQEEKLLVCPYQYMYYYMLMQCTDDNAFKIIGPK